MGRITLGLKGTLLLGCLNGLMGCGDDPIIEAQECINGLTAQEADAGWELLFDGISLEHWRS